MADIASAASATQQTTLEIDTWQFVVPDLSIGAVLVTAWSTTHPVEQGAHDVLNREDPVVVRGARRLARGVLEVQVSTDLERYRLELLFDAGEEVLIKGPGGVAGGRGEYEYAMLAADTWEPSGARDRSVKVPWTGVAAPPVT